MLVDKKRKGISVRQEWLFSDQHTHIVWGDGGHIVVSEETRTWGSRNIALSLRSRSQGWKPAAYNHKQAGRCKKSYPVGKGEYAPQVKQKQASKLYLQQPPLEPQGAPARSHLNRKKRWALVMPIEAEHPMERRLAAIIVISQDTWGNFILGVRRVTLSRWWR